MLSTVCSLIIHPELYCYLSSLTVKVLTYNFTEPTDSQICLLTKISNNYCIIWISISIIWLYHPFLLPQKNLLISFEVHFGKCILQFPIFAQNVSFSTSCAHYLSIPSNATFSMEFSFIRTNEKALVHLYHWTEHVCLLELLCNLLVSKIKHWDSGSKNSVSFIFLSSISLSRKFYTQEA